ncbi:MAG: hypothetical protein H0X40_05110 [Chthoniobacterales bacterium]|nr:hypothetical protein [Chthoniobacterales bacterium]
MFRLALSLSLTIVLCASISLRAQSPASPSPSPVAEPIDALSPADLQRALGFIKKNYVAPAALDDAALDRATLDGLLNRLGYGLNLASKNASAEPAAKSFYHEIMSDRIGYLRPGALHKNDFAELDGTLQNFASKKVNVIILDLRAVAPGSDFPAASEFAQRFVTPGQKLFTLRGTETAHDHVFISERRPAYTGFVTVLIDGETMGAAEVLASVLRAHDKAILIGQPTAGGAVDYSELALADGLILRVAVAAAVLPEQSATAPREVRPDLLVTLSPAVKHQIFSQSLTSGMAPFIFETDQPHLNEAALLAGTNPEIEMMQDRQQRRARGEKSLPRDTVAQRAVDVITSIGVYAKDARGGRAP